MNLVLACKVWGRKDSLEANKVIQKKETNEKDPSKLDEESTKKDSRMRESATLLAGRLI